MFVITGFGTMTGSINHSMGYREWAMLTTLSILWGGSFFFVELVVDKLPPLTIVLTRVSLAAVSLWALVALTRPRRAPPAAAWLAFLLMGLLNNVIPFSLLVWGQSHIASGLAAIINATTPLFTVLVAGFCLVDERPNPARLLGVVTGMAGVAVMIGPEALDGLDDHLLAQFAVLAAALSYALAGVYGRRFKRMRIDPVTTAAGQVTASSLILLPAVLIFEAPRIGSLPGIETFAPLAALGILSTAIAYILYFRLLASAGATNLLLVAFLIPVSAILLGCLVLGESLQAAHFAGMALIGFGLLLIDGRVLPDRRARLAGS